MAWFLLAHLAQLEQKARRTVRLRAQGKALTVGGLGDASMFTPRRSYYLGCSLRLDTVAKRLLLHCPGTISV